MEICYNCEIVWNEKIDGKKCPLCEAREKISELEDNIANLEKEKENDTNFF